jgi:translation initiation factor IF-2
MVDTKTPGDKTLSVPTKTLTLKPRVETGTVRQSFSHGRTKQVVVEKAASAASAATRPRPERMRPSQPPPSAAHRARAAKAPRPPARRAGRRRAQAVPAWCCAR